MIKETITYVDPWSEEEVTEDFYFHFTEAELARLSQERSTLRDEIIRMGNGDATNKEILGLFELIISKAFGERSDNGRFVKSEEITNAFLVSEAYSVLVLSFFGDEDAALKGANFMNGLMPKALVDRAQEASSDEKKISDKPSQEDTAALRARIAERAAANQQAATTEE